MRTSIFTALVLAGLLGGCNTAEHIPPSNLTPGMAKATIIKGQTTQAEVVEVFGPPDLVTHRDGWQIWTWDKVRNDVRQSADNLWLFVYNTSSSRSSSSSTSTMLVVYFDENDIVKDYRMQTTRF